MVTANAASRLIQHYVDNSRALPWRSPPGQPPPDAYVAWLSEVMLQQTTVATVVPRFQSFMRRWPTVEALAAAPDEEILSEWAGLGYYARARNLIACARAVAARGAFPTSAAELRKLPGIGAYTAAAIAAIAFGEEAAAIDTNVERVLSRLHGLANPERSAVERRLLELMTGQRPGDVIQALMDLGATVCRPSRPRCGSCPLGGGCVARASGEPENFPVKRQRKARPHRYGTAWWIERDGDVWLVRRPPAGLLGGMAALPGSEWTEAPRPPQERVGSVRHVFTHFSLDLAVEIRREPVGDGWWHPIDALDAAGLPTLYRKAAALVMNGRRLLAA
ncbi:MAG: A/G-specific adenine glycosylase [Bacillota bacterium]